MTTRKTKIFIGVGSALALLIALGAAFGGGHDESDAYSWDRITRGDIRETITASGEIQARNAYRILEKRNKQEAGKAMLFLGIAQLSLGNKPEAKLAFEKARQLGTKVSYDYMRQCSK